MHIFYSIFSILLVKFFQIIIMASRYSASAYASGDSVFDDSSMPADEEDDIEDISSSVVHVSNPSEPPLSSARGPVRSHPLAAVKPSSTANIAVTQWTQELRELKKRCLM